MPSLDTSVTGLQKLLEQSKAVRSRFEPTWYLNMSYYVGDQWVYWNSGRVDKPKLPRNRLMLVDNRIMPVVNTRVAKKTKQRPIWTVTPNSAEDVDIAAATLGEFVMEERWKSLSMQEKLVEVLYWADICGAGFWKIYWDNTKGDQASFVVDEEGQPLTDQLGRPMRTEQLPQELLAQAQTKTIAQGDVCLEVRSPFEIYPDPLAKSLSEAEWIIEEVVQSPEYLKARYGVDLEGDTDASPGPAEGRSFISAQAAGSSSYKGVKTCEFWCKPNSQFPSGKRIVWAKEQKLYDKDSPYEQHPYVMFTGSPVPGRFWPSSITEQLRSPQTELNKIRSQIAENAQRIGNPSLLKDRGSNVEYTGVPGEEVLYDGMMNSPPSFLQPPEMPMYVREQIDRIEASIREISGQHEVTSSQVPAGVTAASAINLLLEQDDTRLGPTIHDMEQQLSVSGQMVLSLIARFYTDQRMLKLAGEDGDWDIRGFKGEMLRSNTAVEVQAGSAMPVSKAAKQAAMQQTLTLFVQNGVPLEPRTMRKFFRDFEAGGLEHLFADITEGIRQVKRENRLMMSGQPLPINTFDDDDLHIAEHEEMQRGSAFFKAPMQIQQLVEQHVTLHRDRRMKAQEDQQHQQMMQMAQMAQIQEQAKNSGQADILRLKGDLDQQKFGLDVRKANQDLSNKGEEHDMHMSEMRQEMNMELLRFQQEMRQRQADFEAQMKLKKIDAANRRQLTPGGSR